ncbi:hypothetical protein F3Y22_tig00112496pilonHSYRG00059 [Hibiscus syriacus]|uniref:Pectinesterase inhibitor domain-containing protein n=1 Tax=Hibiscus syriacus TaxID=106335 RepID=A0A6A2Y724_HIBSY|nr:hypothetical protein F3Y22_tig00112496pilonHSYRG00059 [Hibiscus syriacus]
MSSKTLLVPMFTIFFLSLVVFSPSTVSADKKLVTRICNEDTIKDTKGCLKTLSKPKTVAAHDINQLVDLVMKEGASKAKKTLNVIEEMMKKPTSPAALTALKTCAEVYRYCVDEFKLVGPELAADAMTANYDVALISPEVDTCIKALQAAKLNDAELNKGNDELNYYASLGYGMTVNLS